MRRDGSGWLIRSMPERESAHAAGALPLSASGVKWDRKRLAVIGPNAGQKDNTLGGYNQKATASKKAWGAGKEVVTVYAGLQACVAARAAAIASFFLGTLMRSKYPSIPQQCVAPRSLLPVNPSTSFSTSCLLDGHFIAICGHHTMALTVFQTTL